MAARDGYIEQVDSISQVMSTRGDISFARRSSHRLRRGDLEHVEVAILSQTGIAALWPANSVEQEVTKLLQ